MDTGDEAIEDETERAQLRRQARMVHVRSVFAGTALTALSLVTPE